jgi:hypothetical protein
MSDEMEFEEHQAAAPPPDPVIGSAELRVLRIPHGDHAVGDRIAWKHGIELTGEIEKMGTDEHGPYIRVKVLSGGVSERGRRKSKQRKQYSRK